MQTSMAYTWLDLCVSIDRCIQGMAMLCGRSQLGTYPMKRFHEVNAAHAKTVSAGHVTTIKEIQVRSKVVEGGDLLCLGW